LQVTQVKVMGLASNSVVAEFKLQENEMDSDLLTLLRDRGIPIASSCYGDGVCQKCLINGDLMACMTSPRELLTRGSNKVQISISYL